MNDREEWRKRVRDIRATSVIWWWWWWHMEKKLYSNYTRILRAILKKTRRQQHPAKSSCKATYHPSRKLYKLDEPDIWDIAKGVGMNSSATYSCGPLHIDEQRKDDKLEPIYNSSVPIQDQPGEMEDSDGWRERVRENHAGGVTWW